MRDQPPSVYFWKRWWVALRSQPLLTRYGSQRAVRWRVAVSLIVGLPLAYLALGVFLVGRSSDPRPAAFLLFFLGILMFFAVPVLRWLWRQPATLQREQLEHFHSEQRIRHDVRKRWSQL